MSTQKLFQILKQPNFWTKSKRTGKNCVNWPSGCLDTGICLALDLELFLALERCASDTPTKRHNRSNNRILMIPLVGANGVRKASEMKWYHGLAKSRSRNLCKARFARRRVLVSTWVQMLDGLDQGRSRAYIGHPPTMHIIQQTAGSQLHDRRTSVSNAGSVRDAGISWCIQFGRITGSGPNLSPKIRTILIRHRSRFFTKSKTLSSLLFFNFLFFSLFSFDWFFFVMVLFQER